MGDSSDNEEVVRQGKGDKARRPIAPPVAGSSNSSGDEDKGIVDCKDAIKKGTRLSAFSVAPEA